MIWGRDFSPLCVEKSKMAIRYLIWDAGGTLFDTYPAVVEALALALREFKKNVALDVIWLLCRKSIGYALKILAEGHALDAAVLAQRYRQRYVAMDAQLQPPFPETVDICRYMCDIGGQNFIVTHRERSLLTKLLDTHKMTFYFTDCITKEDPYPRKPDPAAIMALLARYNLDPGLGMAIGDRELDVIAGQRAGLRTCLFGTESHKTPVDLQVRDFAGLYAWLIAENR